MRALQYTAFGGPEVLAVVDAPEPHAGPGQVRVRVRAAGLNPLDWKIRRGLMSQGRPLEGPGRSGFEAAGVVDEVGEGVTGTAVGDDVFGLGEATHAELALLDAWAAKPAAVDWAVAAGSAVAAEVSVRVLDLLGVGAGSTLLVDGGAGGVGAVGVQLAVSRGATVIASAGEANQGYLTEIGALPVRYGDGLAERVRAVAPEGLDAVFDVAGKTPPPTLASMVSDPAQVVTISQFELGDSGIRVTTEPGDRAAALAEAARLLESNGLVVEVQTFPLERAREAVEISESGHVRGKLVLLP
ncbi:NADP-dependent oxidoreductase [Microlunatus capsulatus]|uniref:NADPH:quinone reductase-like Zn-dependent oxidoreductase n=1 Tax=Microlunatus capsulatus TaxID=99117 RepID=A0ABS4Z4M0_9ACTN|nr:NADP-dependent oxidoreductase [Microlunatus capsulatus]MBP2415996.1 NADPH:quinone reductase-like Zn-dependent oxidoreductase [Microlunatus capsulatus]